MLPFKLELAWTAVRREQACRGAADAAVEETQAVNANPKMTTNAAASRPHFTRVVYHPCPAVAP